VSTFEGLAASEARICLARRAAPSAHTAKPPVDPKNRRLCLVPHTCRRNGIVRVPNRQAKRLTLHRTSHLMRNGRDAPVQPPEHSAPAGTLKCLLGEVHMSVPNLDRAAFEKGRARIRPIANGCLTRKRLGGSSSCGAAVRRRERNELQTNIKSPRLALT
jgi:hypothetical protein